MDLPLDDLIKSHRRSGGRGGRRGGGNDNRTGGGAFRRQRNSQRNNPYKSNRGDDRGNVEGVWEHDRFDDDEEEEEEIIERPVRSLSSSGGLETGAKLQISNLAFGVSDDDIKDLFEPLGDIKKAFVHYDKKDGRSLGLATVIYAKRTSALEAIKKYNNVPLDGQAMKITLVATTGGAGGGGGAGAGGARRVARGGDDGGVRSFRKAVSDAESFTIRVGGGNRGTRQAGRRVVVGRRGGRGAGGGGGGGGGGGRGGRGGRSGGRQVYVRY